VHYLAEGVLRCLAFAKFELLCTSIEELSFGNVVP